MNIAYSHGGMKRYLIALFSSTYSFIKYSNTFSFCIFPLT